MNNTQQMSNDTGLPDYVGDHFKYLITASPKARFGQAIFFGSSFLLPILTAVSVFIWSGKYAGAATILFMSEGAVFAGSTLWYLWWMQRRLDVFRTERPVSYERWYGLHRTRSFGGLNLPGQWRLAVIQARYVFLGKIPSAAQTLDLTMEFARRDQTLRRDP